MNQEELQKFHLACIACGTKDTLHIISHTNPKGEIVGLMHCCDLCHNSIANGKVQVRVQEVGSANN